MSTYPARLTVVVDGANVVGSRPDGWWRDRAGAARRLRTALTGLPGRTVVVPDGSPVVVGEVVLVLEGLASVVATEAPTRPGEPRVVAAAGSGDDEIVRQAGAARAPTLVVTADRELRARVEALGAAVAGPRWLHPHTRRPDDDAAQPPGPNS